VTPTSTTSSRGSPACTSRSGPQSDYYDYYDAAVTAPLPDAIRSSPSGGRPPQAPPARRGCRDSASPVTSSSTRALTDRPVKFSLTGPFSLSPPDYRRRRSVREPGRARPRPGQAAQHRGARPGGRRRAVPADRRAVPRGLPGSGGPGGRGLEYCHRRRAGHLGAPRLATGTATPGPPGRGTTTSFSPRCSRRGSTSSCSSSPARAWRTCG